MGTAGKRTAAVIVLSVCGVAAVVALTAIAASGGLSDLGIRIAYAFAFARMKGAPSGPPPALFRQFVLDPIPESVTDLKADRTQELFGYGYAFHFKVSRDDLYLISRSRPFQRVVGIECTEDSFISWELESTGRETILVYAPGQRRPKWFRPDTWVDPESYVTADGDIRVLIYNDKGGEAYLVIQSK
jgi:hypothetical protein